MSLLLAALDWIKNWLMAWGGIGAIVSAGLWALWYFTPITSSKTPILHAAVVATTLTVSTTYISAHYFDLGYQTAILQVAAQNKEATDAVNKALKTVDDCIDANGRWDSTVGLCDKQ